MFELAGHLKIGTVAEMLARMTQREFVQWQIRNKTNPIGAWRDDLRIGAAISPIINLMLHLH